MRTTLLWISFGLTFLSASLAIMKVFREKLTKLLHSRTGKWVVGIALVIAALSVLIWIQISSIGRGIPKSREIIGMGFVWGVAGVALVMAIAVSIEIRSLMGIAIVLGSILGLVVLVWLESTTTLPIFFGFVATDLADMSLYDAFRSAALESVAVVGLLFALVLTWSLWVGFVTLLGLGVDRYFRKDYSVPLASLFLVSIAGLIQTLVSLGLWD